MSSICTRAWDMNGLEWIRPVGFSSCYLVWSRSWCLPSFISQSVKKSDQFDLDLRPAWKPSNTCIYILIYLFLLMCICIFTIYSYSYMFHFCWKLMSTILLESWWLLYIGRLFTNTSIYLTNKSDEMLHNYLFVDHWKCSKWSGLKSGSPSFFSLKGSSTGRTHKML